ncbi:MAG: hypothetical protein GY820_21130 [Gammaproteobacteria bacterium]|nr:hypothetical protein [Gammaproteobacteria bacterium]
MRNYNDEELLQMVEMYAETQGYISSEEELSDMFDSYMEEVLDSMSYVDAQRLLNDKPALNELFGQYVDALCKNGEIHPIQYAEYAYEGAYSES